MEFLFTHRSAQAFREHCKDVNLKPSTGKELTNLSILSGNDTQLPLRASVVVEIFEHAVAMQQSSKLHRSGTAGLGITIDVNALSTTGSDTALHLFVELRKQIEVGTQVTGKVLESFIAVEVILPLVNHNLAGL